MSSIRTRVGFLTSVFMVMLVGCGQTPEQKRIAELSAENEALRSQLNDKDRQLNDMTGRDESASGAVSGLRSENQSLRDQLASSQAELAKLRSMPAPTGPKGDIPEGQWVQMPGFDMLSISGEVLFDSGKSTLKPTGKTTLDRIASEIRSRYPDRDIFVFGHTDNEPIKRSGWKDNWQLGSERALTCVRTLVGAGIPSGRLIQANCGENRPRVANNNANNKRMNRRVEFYAVEKKGNRGLMESTASADMPTTGTRTTGNR